MHEKRRETMNPKAALKSSFKIQTDARKITPRPVLCNEATRVILVTRSSTRTLFFLFFSRGPELICDGQPRERREETWADKVRKELFIWR